MISPLFTNASCSQHNRRWKQNWGLWLSKGGANFDTNFILYSINRLRRRVQNKTNAGLARQKWRKIVRRCKDVDSRTQWPPAFLAHPVGSTVAVKWWHWRRRKPHFRTIYMCDLTMFWAEPVGKRLDSTGRARLIFRAVNSTIITRYLHKNKAPLNCNRESALVQRTCLNHPIISARGWRRESCPSVRISQFLFVGLLICFPAQNNSKTRKDWEG